MRTSNAAADKTNQRVIALLGVFMKNLQELSSDNDQAQKNYQSPFHL